PHYKLAITHLKLTSDIKDFTRFLLLKSFHENSLICEAKALRADVSLNRTGIRRLIQCAAALFHASERRSIIVSNCRGSARQPPRRVLHLKTWSQLLLSLVFLTGQGGTANSSFPYNAFTRSIPCHAISLECSWRRQTLCSSSRVKLSPAKP